MAKTDDDKPADAAPEAPAAEAPAATPDGPSTNLTANTVNPVHPESADGGYVGVDPIYQNAANETEQPL